MKKIQLSFVSMLMIFALTNTSVLGQVPAEQDTIVIEGGPTNIGLLETTINSDVEPGTDNRINPNRVYLLKKNTVYFQNSGILFGGESDSTATLNIVGEEGGNLPIILMQPQDGVDKFENLVHGNLTIKNVFWPITNLTGGSAALFKMFRSNITVRCENLVTDIALGHAAFHFRNVLGPMSLFIKSSYFRDNTQFENSWNWGLYARGDNGEPFDTLWIENTTITNAGMPLFGKFNPVNFFFFDHNTIVNTCKYPIWHEQLKEAYITNNMFVNANYEGECQSTANTQMSADGTFNGIINLHPIDERFWDNPPSMDDVKFLAANNLSYRSPFLDSYYNGGYNTVGDKPISNRAWGGITDDQLPIFVENVPVKMFSELTEDIIEQNAGYKEADNHDMDIDPELVTKGIGSQEKADAFVKHMRNNYGVAGPDEARDKTLMYFGDANPQTVPGIEVEDGTGFTKISDFIEDFTYGADIRSTIDGKPIGALTWWDMDYSGDQSLDYIKGYYVDPGSWVIPSGIFDARIPETSFSIYPNPARNELHIVSEIELQSVSLYDLLGKLVARYDLNGAMSETIGISDLNAGIFLLSIETVSGSTALSKFIKE